MYRHPWCAIPLCKNIKSNCLFSVHSYALASKLGKHLREERRTGQHCRLFALAKEKCCAVYVADDVAPIIEWRCVFRQPSSHLRFPTRGQEVLKGIGGNGHVGNLLLLGSITVDVLTAAVSVSVLIKFPKAPLWEFSSFSFLFRLGWVRQAWLSNTSQKNRRVAIIYARIVRWFNFNFGDSREVEVNFAVASACAHHRQRQACLFQLFGVFLDLFLESTTLKYGTWYLCEKS